MNHGFHLPAPGSSCAIALTVTTNISTIRGKDFFIAFSFYDQEYGETVYAPSRSNKQQTDPDKRRICVNGEVRARPAGGFFSV
jgi:hypothetical protein